MKSLEGPAQERCPKEVELNPGAGLCAEGEQVSGPEAKKKLSVRGIAGLSHVGGRQARSEVGRGREDLGPL